jgi:hypothetical protein
VRDPDGAWLGRRRWGRWGRFVETVPARRYTDIRVSWWLYSTWLADDKERKSHRGRRTTGIQSHCVAENGAQKHDKKDQNSRTIFRHVGNYEDVPKLVGK